MVFLSLVNTIVARKSTVCHALSMQLLDGKLTATNWLTSMQPELAGLGLGIVLVGNNPASEMYVKMKSQKANALGIITNVQLLADAAGVNEVIEVIETFNHNPSITGIMVQLPLPEHLLPYTRTILDSILYSKDVDVLSGARLSQILTSDESLLPATPTGILRLLSQYAISVTGKHCVMVGTSLLVGTPLAIRLQQLGATVTMCDKYTVDLEEHTLRADIVISAVGKSGLITEDYIKPGAVVVDVGTSEVNGKMVGDVVFDQVSLLASYITPSPGGVGPMTIAALFSNLLTLNKR
jgi:methylenetetrahydrofolate dehydrogenase (NADP+) / methenyltetrahydrofolate cyclohydrolase